MSRLCDAQHFFLSRFFHDPHTSLTILGQSSQSVVCRTLCRSRVFAWKRWVFPWKGWVQLKIQAQGPLALAAFDERLSRFTIAFPCILPPAVARSEPF